MPIDDVPLDDKALDNQMKLVWSDGIFCGSTIFWTLMAARQGKAKPSRETVKNTQCADYLRQIDEYELMSIPGI
jgi:hypothetical protein